MAYPNLGLLEYRFNEVLLSEHDSSKRFIPDCDVFMFPQTWPNTGGGFARKGYFYGDAMTRQYTTVLINHHENVAMVCFGDRPAYFVKPVPSTFYDDLKKQSMAGVEDTSRYDNINIRDVEEQP